MQEKQHLLKDILQASLRKNMNVSLEKMLCSKFSILYLLIGLFVKIFKVPFRP